MTNMIGAIVAFMFVAVIFTGVISGNKKAEDFRREISCIESGREWVNGGCK